MKKTILSVIMLVGISLSIAAEDTIPASFPRKFLLEQFTGQTCGNCPNGILGINQFLREDSREYIWIAHHVGYATDAYTISESNNIKNILNVQAAPNVCINRNYQKINGIKTRCYVPTSLVDGSLEIIDSATSPLSVIIDREYNAETRELKITVHGQVADTNITHINLSTVIKENALAGKQSDYYFAWDGYWAEYLHMATLRDFYCSKAIGDEITITNQAYSKTYTVTVDSVWVDTNCTLVAFVTDTDGRNVYNAEEVPLMDGTTGGNDCIAYGITQNATPNTTLVFPQILVQEQAAENILQLMLLSNQNMRGSSTFAYGICRPVLLLYVMTTDKQLRAGTYPILNDMSQGSAVAGFRVDTLGSLGGSLL
ncbi:MAG: Omp28-related outer membrane protein, partial [Paludibacteraceae bacterium]